MNTNTDIGRTILGGKYRITGEIGRGGMGVVYKGTQSSLGRSVAIKVLPAQIAQDREFVNRFRREAEALGRLNHPNIVTIHDLDAEGDEQFLVMECVDGRDLSSILEPGRAVPIYLAVSIAIQTAEALEAAHRCGIIHRDVKPQNILIEEITGRVKVADFGVAVMTDATSLTRTGSVIGTPKYMSPEQIQGMPATGASDVYSLGVVLYEMLAGRAPFVGETAMSIAYQHVDGTLPPLAGLAPEAPPALVKIVERALQKQPDRRFATAGEMAQALRSVPVKQSDRPGGRTERTKRRRVVPRVVLAGGVAALAVVAVFVGRQFQALEAPAVKTETPSSPNAQGEAASEVAAPIEEKGAEVSARLVGQASTDEANSIPAPPASEPQEHQASVGGEGNRPGASAAPPGREAGSRSDEAGVPSERQTTDAVRNDVPPREAIVPPPPITPEIGSQPGDEPAAKPPGAQTTPPNPNREIFDSAQRALRGANYSGALAGYRNYLERGPDPDLADDAQHGVAESLYNLGNYAAAIPEYRRVADSYPDSKWADDSSYAIAWCYEQQRDYANAIPSYESFIRKYPDSTLAVEAQYRAARCRFDSGDYAGALPAYEMVLRKYPRSAYGDLSQYAIGECSYKQGDFASAAGGYAQVVLNFPDSQWADDAQASVGWSYFKLKEYDRALREFSQVEQRYPQSEQVPTAKVQAARCHLALGDRAAAERALRDVIQRFPGSKAAGEARETLATLR